MNSPFYDICLAAAFMKVNVTITSITRDAAQDEFEALLQELIEKLVNKGISE